jgi:OPT family oligopeptide transporter
VMHNDNNNDDDFSGPLERITDPGSMDSENLASAGETAQAPPDGQDAEAAARWWLENVYCGDRMRQLSVRAIVSGMLIGALMSVSNLYVGLKAGWTLGVTVTSCIIAYAVFKTLEAVIPAYRRNPFTILENCTMTSAASAAGTISAAGMVSSIPALYLLTGRPLPIWQMMIWIGSIVILGLFMAVPLKRQLINIDKLAFPSGTATAETLKSLHSTGGEAVGQAKALFYCTIFSSLLKIWVDAWSPIMIWLGDKLKSPELGKSLAKYAFPDNFPIIPGKFGNYLLEHYTICFEGSVFMMAAGAIMGIRIGVSLLLGAIFFYGLMAPILESEHIITIVPGRALSGISGAWTVWPAVALMVSAALTAFALRWRIILRAFGGLTAVFRAKPKQEDPLARIEIPTWWFLAGVATACVSCVIFGQLFFQIRWWMSVLAVAITFILSVVAARATGETDITPIGAMGKITQLTYGIIAPTNITTNLMTASITAGAAAQSADLLTDLKAGYLVGTNPRRQTIAQFFGVLAGVIVCVPIYTIIVRMPVFDPNAPSEKVASQVSSTSAADSATGTANANGSASATMTTQAKDNSTDNKTQTNLLTKEFPAPSVAVWKSVAELLAEGVHKLKKGTVIGMIIGGLLGILIALAEEFLPKRYAKWIPSATGLGIAGVIPAYNSISMFIGAFAAWIWMKMHRKSAESYIIPCSSGLIAGESLTGVTISVWQAAPALWSATVKYLFH